jgi:hypothetical protein
LVSKIGKPQLKPTRSPLGLFSFCWSRLLPSQLGSAFRLKMTPNTPEKYTVKHIGEITDRIVALRVRWLRHVETQLASRQSRPVLDHYKLSTEAAE